MRGIVKKVQTGDLSNPALNPNMYTIEGEDGKEYIAHVGDLKDNEKKLYDLDKEGKTSILNEDERVEFIPETRAHAIHVKKINS